MKVINIVLGAANGGLLLIPDRHLSRSTNFWPVQKR